MQGGPEEGEGEGEVSCAMRARAERQRLRARALRDARLAAANHYTIPAGGCGADTGGGFVAETAAAGAPRVVAAPPAPLADPAARPPCLECDRSLAHSYLLDTFDYAVCDDCRDEQGAHSLVTRTEAKTEYLLRDCDVDARGPALRCVRRANPHAPRADMRLYLRAQVEERALAVWGSEARLEDELARRAEKREARRGAAEARRLRALRLAVRGSLFAGARPPHEHEFGAETFDEAAGLYSRACACGHTQTYEKM